MANVAPSTAGAIVFVDTHVLLHADDAFDADAQARARAWLQALWQRRAGRVSTQVLNEYIQVGLRKLGLPHSHVRAQLQCYRQLDLAGVTPDTIDMALDLHQSHSLSYWDALILASAHIAGCAVLLTEDMGTGEVLAGVQLVNPFAAT